MKIKEMKKLILFTCVLMITSSCNNDPANKGRILSEKEKIELLKINVLSKEEGLLSLRTNCYACHNPNSESHDKMLAPPLAGIKYNYMKSYPERELFVAQMSDYVLNPSKENAMMKGPIRRFGLMPKTTLTLDEIRELSLFIYDNELKVPDWFPIHFEEKHNKPWGN